MHKSIEPSRLLNDQRGVFGLTICDFVAAIGIFVMATIVLEETAYGILSLPLSILCLAGLAPIRLSIRRKIIRDTLGYLVTPRKLYAPHVRA